MSFLRQQLITVAVSFLAYGLLVVYGRSALRLDCATGGYVLDTMAHLLSFVSVGASAVVAFRLVFWLAWSGDRGERFLNLWRLSKGKQSDFGPVLRWWLHIDREGNDLDARS